MKPPSRSRNSDPKRRWLRWFAWHPVHFRSESRWLTYVERRWDSGEKTGEAKWQYRSPRNQPPPADAVRPQNSSVASCNQNVILIALVVLWSSLFFSVHLGHIKCPSSIRRSRGARRLVTSRSNATVRTIYRCAALFAYPTDFVIWGRVTSRGQLEARTRAQRNRPLKMSRWLQASD